jgi:hypothetical protein
LQVLAQNQPVLARIDQSSPASSHEPSIAAWSTTAKGQALRCFSLRCVSWSACGFSARCGLTISAKAFAIIAAGGAARQRHRRYCSKDARWRQSGCPRAIAAFATRPAPAKRRSTGGAPLPAMCPCPVRRVPPGGGCHQSDESSSLPSKSQP